MPNISKIILMAVLACAARGETALANQSVAVYGAADAERANPSAGRGVDRALPAARHNQAVGPALGPTPRTTAVAVRSSPAVRVTQRKKNETSRPVSDGWSSLASTAGSLIVVLGLLFAVVWLMRRTAPKSARTLPTEVFEVLGRSPLTARGEVHLLRCGNKLLLVSVTPAGAETLTEITDAQQVDRLCGLCARDETQSATNVFRGVLKQFSREGAASGFLGDRPGGTGDRPGGTIALAGAGETPTSEAADG